MINVSPQPPHLSKGWFLNIGAGSSVLSVLYTSAAIIFKLSL